MPIERASARSPRLEVAMVKNALNLLGSPVEWHVLLA
jgi:hypothetical protein